MKSRTTRTFAGIASLLVSWCTVAPLIGAEPDSKNGLPLQWKRLPDLPGPLGVAGPAVGVHQDVLIVAGGANFPLPVWENDKVWRDSIFAMRRTGAGFVWRESGKLKRSLGYSASVSTKDGVVCMGGNDAEHVYRDVFLLRWNKQEQRVEQVAYPPLPSTCAFGQAVLIGNMIYMAGGQSGLGLDSALKNFWALDLSEKQDSSQFKWRALKPWPAESRSLNLTAAQHNGRETCVYVMSGRREENGATEFLRDVWEYSPSTDVWRRRADAPRAIMAGMAAGLGKQEIFVLGGADGAQFDKVDELRDKHPGFPKEALAFNAVANKWTSAGAMPASHVTTVPVVWGGRIIIASGEIRPRVRTKAVWSVGPSIR